jgi:hypothetical protein
MYHKVKKVEKVERGRGRKKMIVSPEQERIAKSVLDAAFAVHSWRWFNIPRLCG